MSIQSEIERLQGVKSGIKNAIVESGIDVPDNTPFAEYANKTSQIIGQFDSKLDEIIGGEIVPMLDVQQRLEAINGVSGDVSTQLDTLDNTKADITAAIIEKGVDIREGTPFSQYADLIAGIKTGGGSTQIVVETYDILLGEEPLNDGNQDVIMLLYQNGKYTFTVTAAQGETLLVAMLIPSEDPSTMPNDPVLIASTSEPNVSTDMSHPETYAKIFLSSTECEFRFLDPMDLASSTRFGCYIIKSIN